MASEFSSIYSGLIYSQDVTLRFRGYVDTVNWNKRNISGIEAEVNSCHDRRQKLLTAVLEFYSSPAVFS